MEPPPFYDHSEGQFSVAEMLGRLMESGRVATEVPLSTARGIRIADVTWISAARRSRTVRPGLLTVAPEICVEVLSASNSRGEIEEKIALYSRRVPTRSGSSAWTAACALSSKGHRKWPRRRLCCAPASRSGFCGGSVLRTRGDHGGLRGGDGPGSGPGSGPGLRLAIEATAWRGIWGRLVLLRLAAMPAGGLPGGGRGGGGRTRRRLSRG
ncbi:hypothetical protein BH23VER1_BH23VER1_13920 [soil metagenome]